MRTIIGAAAAMTMAAAGAAHAQTSETPFVSSAEVAALIAKARAEHKPGQPLESHRLMQLAPYNANLEYRTGAGASAIHETEAELFYVLEGSGTVVTGGKLTNQTRPNPTNLTGTAVEGGQARKVAKGDMFFVPEGVPHWFSGVDGTLVLMSLHVPRGQKAP